MVESTSGPGPKVTATALAMATATAVATAATWARAVPSSKMTSQQHRQPHQHQHQHQHQQLTPPGSVSPASLFAPVLPAHAPGDFGASPSGSLLPFHSPWSSRRPSSAGRTSPAPSEPARRRSPSIFTTSTSPPGTRPSSPRLRLRRPSSPLPPPGQQHGKSGSSASNIATSPELLSPGMHSRRGSAPPGAAPSDGLGINTSSQADLHLKRRPRPILLSRPSTPSSFSGAGASGAHWSLPTAAGTLPSPSWVGPQATPSNAVVAASAAFATGSPLARRVSVIEAWCHWDSEHEDGRTLAGISSIFHRIADLVAEAGLPLATVLLHVKDVCRVPNLQHLDDADVSPLPLIHRLLDRLQHVAERLALEDGIVSEGTIEGVGVALLNAEMNGLREHVLSWSKLSAPTIARRRTEFRIILAEHTDRFDSALRNLMSPSEETYAKSLITSVHGKLLFRHLARSLRPLRQRALSRADDDFRLPSAALSPVLQSLSTSPPRDSFALPPVDAAARELVQRLRDLDNVFQTLELDSPTMVRNSVADSETDIDSQVEIDSDLDSLNGDEAAAIRSPRMGTTQICSLAHDLASNLESLSPRALAQKLNRLASGLIALRILPNAAVVVASCEVALYRKQSLLETPAGRADLVNALDNLASALETAGRVEESVTLTEEAVELLRSLRSQRLNALQATFGTSLLKLARRLAMVARYTDALVASDEALQVLRSLDTYDQIKHRSDLATALFSKAACLHLLGRRQPAATAGKEALMLRRAVAQQRRCTAHARALAESHLQLAEFHTQENDPVNALNASADALKAIRSVTSADGSMDEFFATTLLIHAAHLRLRHQLQSATEMTREAVQIYRNLSAQEDDNITGLLARALCRLGQDELDLQPSVLTLTSPRMADHPALAIYAEAVGSLRHLSSFCPTEYGRDLAKALLAYSTCLSSAGREAESISLARESQQLMKKLSAHFPLNEDDYVKVLLRLSAAFSRNGSPQEGLAISDELVELQRNRAAIQPEAYQADLARALCNHSFFLDAAGQSDDALAICEESVRVLRIAVARNDGKATRTDLALAVRQLAGRHRAAGQMQEALSKMQEAVELLRSVSERQSGLIVDLASSEVNLGRSLRDVATILGSLGRHTQGVMVVKDSVRVFRTLDTMEPGLHQIDLARSLNELANRLAEAGERHEAVQVAKEAVALWQEICSIPEQKRHLPDLAFSTWALSRRLSDVENFGEAAKMIEPVISIFRELAKLYPERWQAHLEGALGTQTHLLHESGQPIRAFSKTRTLKRLRNMHK